MLSNVRLDRRNVVPVALGLVVLFGIGDYLTDVEITFTLLYLLPVTLAAWHRGRPFGLALAVLATLFAMATVAIGGIAPPPDSIVTYRVGATTETMKVGKIGWAEFDNAYRLPKIRRLWTALRGGSSVTVIYSGGASHSFPLRDSAKVMPDSVCAP